MNNNKNDFSLSKEIVYDFISGIIDPERGCTIEELEIVSEDWIEVFKPGDKDGVNYERIVITWKPTVPNCSFAVNIGLSIRHKLNLEIPKFINSLGKIYKYKIDVIIYPGSHSTENEINKQVNDKERFSAALESPDILNYINSLVMG